MPSTLHLGYGITPQYRVGVEETYHFLNRSAAGAAYIRFRVSFRGYKMSLKSIK